MTILETFIQIRDDLREWVKNNLILKVDKVDGKGLSTNDFSNAYKSKLDGITESADAVSFSRSLSSGKKIGSITINGTSTDIYALSTNDFSNAYKSKLDGITASADAVSFSRSLSSGKKIGTININGTSTDIYAPPITDSLSTTSSDTALSATAGKSLQTQITTVSNKVTTVDNKLKTAFILSGTTLTIDLDKLNS